MGFSLRLRARAVIAAIAALGLTATCGGSGEEDRSGASGRKEESSGLGTLSVQIVEPQHLAPGNTKDVPGLQVLSALFTGLVEYDPATSAPVNAVARSITSPDQRNWTIDLAPGWTFHDGEAVTAASFVNAWNFAAYSPNAQGNAAFFENILGYEGLAGDPEATPPVAPQAKELRGLMVIDEDTFTVTLKEPFSQFPLTLGYSAFYPLPKSAYADPAAFEQAPVGNGPFRMDGRWEHDVAVKVVRFDSYPGPKPEASAVEFRIYSDTETAYRDLLAGNLDVVSEVPAARLVEARAELGPRLLERASGAINYLGFPLYRKEFQRKELRWAISLAIDRRAIVDTVFSGAREPASSLVPPIVAGSRKDACRMCRYDPEEARRLLAAAGGWNGTLRLWLNGGAGHEDWMEAISNQLRGALGIEKIEFQVMEFPEFLSSLDARKATGPFRGSWSMDYPTPQNFLEPLYSTTGATNRFAYSNPRVDELIAEGNRASDLDSGIARYQEAEDLILDDLPAVPLWFGRIQAARSARVGDLTVDAFSRVRVERARLAR